MGATQVLLTGYHKFADGIDIADDSNSNNNNDPKNTTPSKVNVLGSTVNISLASLFPIGYEHTVVSLSMDVKRAYALSVPHSQIKHCGFNYGGLLNLTWQKSSLIEQGSSVGLYAYGSTAFGCEVSSVNFSLFQAVALTLLNEPAANSSKINAEPVAEWTTSVGFTLSKSTFMDRLKIFTGGEFYFGKEGFNSYMVWSGLSLDLKKTELSLSLTLFGDSLLFLSQDFLNSESLPALQGLNHYFFFNMAAKVPIKNVDMAVSLGVLSQRVVPEQPLTLSGVLGSLSYAFN